MLLTSHPFLTHSPVKAQLTPPIRIVTSTPRIGTPARTQDAARRLGEPGDQWPRSLHRKPPRRQRADAVKVGGLGHYIDDHLGDDRFHIS